MDWFEKEMNFGKRPAAKTLGQYIPKKFEEAIDWTEICDDGYFIYLNEGFRAYDGGEDCCVIHEFNIKDLRAAVKTIRKV